MYINLHAIRNAPDCRKNSHQATRVPLYARRRDTRITRDFTSDSDSIVSYGMQSDSVAVQSAMQEGQILWDSSTWGAIRNRHFAQQMILIMKWHHLSLHFFEFIFVIASTQIHTHSPQRVSLVCRPSHVFKYYPICGAKCWSCSNRVHKKKHKKFQKHRSDRIWEWKISKICLVVYGSMGSCHRQKWRWREEEEKRKSFAELTNYYYHHRRHRDPWQNCHFDKNINTL